MHTHLQNHFARIFATNPAVPSPVAPEALEALRVRADREYQQHRESGNYHRALQLQLQVQQQREWEYQG